MKILITGAAGYIGSIVTEELGLGRLKGRVDEHVQDLCDRGIIDIKSLLEIGISGVALEDLSSFLTSLFTRLQRNGNKSQE